MSMEGMERCTNTFSEATFQDVLSPRTKKNLDVHKTLCELRSAGLNPQTCPRCDDQWYMVDDAVDGVFYCRQCRFQHCVHCMEAPHPNMSCEEAAEDAVPRRRKGWQLVGVPP